MLCHIVFSALFDQSAGFGLAGTGHRWLLIQFCLILRSTHIEHIVLNFSIPIKLPTYLPGDFPVHLAHYTIAPLRIRVTRLGVILWFPFATVYFNAPALLLEGVLHHPYLIHKLTVRKLSPGHAGVYCISFPDWRCIPSALVAPATGLYAQCIFRPVPQPSLFLLS